MRTISEFQIVDHGREYSQYFQGCGVAFTPFTECATGIGDNYAEALDDALEQVAQCGFDAEDLEKRILAELSAAGLDPGDSPSIAEDIGDTEDLFYHLSIRWR